MIGSVVSHYRVLSPLGAGGMGVVYLAEDLRLGRQVAIKFLPPESATSPQALERFHLEARAVSLLSHPGICALYDIGMHDGAPFLVMERLKGETLRARIARGRVPVSEVLDIGIQLAEALEAAHAQGIVHRDIKPANIWVGEKLRVKILDFGLAKLAPPGDAFGMGVADGDEAHATRVVSPRIENPLTTPGMAIGTALYMSPEQARGEVVDARTDIFSLGVVLYEMLTGQQAFAGSTAAVVFDAILNRMPIPPSAHNPAIPGRLQDVVQATLEKRREDRLQSAALLEGELRRIRRDVQSTVRGPATLVHPSAPSPSDAALTAPTEVRVSGTNDATMVVPAPFATSTGSGSSPSRAPTVAAPPASAVAAGATTIAEAASEPSRRGGWAVAMLAIGVAAAVAVWAISRTTSGPVTPPAVADLVARAQQRLDAHDLRGALVEAGAALSHDATSAEAARIKGEVEAALTRLDAAVGEARRALGTGDLATAGAALETAQALAPGDPLVVSLAAQLGRAATPTSASGSAGASPATTADPSASVATSAARRAATTPTTTVPSEPSRATDSTRPAPASPVTSAPSSSAAGTSGAAPGPGSTPSLPAPAPPEPVVNAGPRPGDTPAAEPRPAPSDPAPATSRAAAPERESDDAAVRRAVRTYAQAIENKDLTLFRTIRPDLSQDEEKRLRASFQQVERQRVDLRLEAVTVTGDRADVRVTREDTIESGGRTQTSRSTQTMRLARRGEVWVIVSLGR